MEVFHESMDGFESRLAGLYGYKNSPAIPIFGMSLFQNYLSVSFLVL